MTARLLTVTETADMLQLSKVTVYRLMTAGQLRYVQIGARRRVTAAEVDRFLTKHTGVVA